MEFQYFEVRPVIEIDGACVSYRTYEDFEADRDDWKEQGRQFETFWTLYGVAGSYVRAIGDFTDQATALQIMNAILAPMAHARDILDAGSAPSSDRETLVERSREASAVLEDFIMQCSNEDRV
jgi:hypothetical protein